jgi:CubicO group peptidase (beta-lactamase class C family)
MHAPFRRTRNALAAAALLALGLCASAQTPPKFPDAIASDPVTMGWMAGFPPPPDRVIRWADGSAYAFPQLRWSFSNFRRLAPTSNVSRGVHGQVVYIDPKAEMVIARYASFPLAANANLDPTSLPAYHALARHLIANPR